MEDEETGEQQVVSLYSAIVNIYSSWFQALQWNVYIVCDY